MGVCVCVSVGVWVQGRSRAWGTPIMCVGARLCVGVLSERGEVFIKGCLN